ncbi:MAG: Fic family protein [Actinobacteria bacterium]|nr:Fic family protein [Actinomycetota bacterium]
MFKPNYTITNKLLSNIKQISSMVLELNNRRFSKVILYELERRAREISTYASTSIEGNPLPLTDVKQILKTQPQNLRSSEQEVINYNKALEELNKNLQKGPIPISLDLILSIQKQVVDKLVPKYQCGKLREEPVFVNNPKMGKTVYWPPDAKDVPQLMKDLVSFTTNSKGVIDPLIIAGIFHKQFVIIHPFMDGNGRTARLTTKILLADMDLNTFNLFSFENYYNRNVTSYFNNVGVLDNYYDIVNSIDFTHWLEYFTDGIIDELSRVKKLLPKISASPKEELMSYHKKILEFIRKKGYISDKDYKKLTNRAKATRNLDFNKLIDMGLIERKGKGKATYYQIREKS